MISIYPIRATVILAAFAAAIPAVILFWMVTDYILRNGK